MHFAKVFLATVATVSSVVSATVLASRSTKPLIPRTFIDICAVIDLDLEVPPFIFGHIDVCLCLSLIPEFVKTNGPAREAAQVLGTQPVHDWFANYIQQHHHSECQYPDHATPICSANCDFECKPPYVKKGKTCVLPPSQHKRSPVEIEREQNRCAYGLSKCGVPGVVGSQPYECLDTQSNLESCGGCASPFVTALTSPGPKGVDCTSLPGVADVDCQRGSCLVRKCRPGFQLTPKVDAAGANEFECVANDSLRTQQPAWNNVF